MIVEPRTKRERRRSFPCVLWKNFLSKNFCEHALFCEYALFQAPQAPRKCPSRKIFLRPPAPGTFAVLTASDASRLSRAELLRSTVGKYHRQVGRMG